MIPTLPSIISRLRLKQLRLLIALADYGSLINAANHVHMTQPGATKALKEIESVIGSVLFARSNRGIEPNALGHCVVRYARLILTDLSHLRDELLGILQGHGGRLAVGTIMGAVPFLTKALSRLWQKQPTVSVQIVEDNSAKLLELLDQGRLDIAICRISVSENPDLYRAVGVRDEALAVVANLDHPLADAKALNLVDLACYRWVVCAANMPMRLLLEREFHEAGIPFPASPIETTSVLAILSLLQLDRSIVALLPIDVAKMCEKFGLVKLLPITMHSQSEPYFMVTRLDRALTPVTELFIAEFESQFSR